MEQIQNFPLNQGSGTINDENKDAITTAVNSLPQSEESRIYEEIHNNPDMVNENVPKEGYSKPVKVTYDAATEETHIDDFNLDGGDFEDIKIEYDVTEEDVKSHSDLSIANFENMSDEAALELVKLINKTRKGNSVKFSDLPEEIQTGLTEYLEAAFDIPISDHSKRSNQIRNSIADTMMQEYIKVIEIDKYVEHFNYKVEHLFDDTINELSPIFKQYNDANNKHIEELIAKADTPEKKEIGEKIVAAIKDAYNLESIKELIPKTRIKKFEVEKPNRVFDSIHGKYNSPKYHIYNLYGCAATLSKHLFNNGIISDARRSRDLAIKLLLVFCHKCRNFKTEVTSDNAYMYYFTYNIYLLDMYKGEQYEEYVDDYLKGYIKEAIDILEQSGK